MNDVQASTRFPIATIKGFLILVGGLVFFFAIYIPQTAILAIMNTDLLTALYLSLEHGVLDTCYILAAFYFMTAILARRATLFDMGLVQIPFFENMPTRRFSTFAIGAFFLLTSLALVVIGDFVLLIVQVQWELLLQNAFHLIAPVSNWGLPDLLKQKPVAFGVEAFVLCILAPFAEEVLFRGMLFQWLARRFGLWTGVLASAFIFSIIHASIFGFANLFVLGIFAALLLRTSRSLWPGIILHSLWNVLFLLFALGVLR